MRSTNGPRWFDRRRPENTWPSVVVSIAATAGLFASAFVAMQTVGRWSARSNERLAPPVVVTLTPPPTPPIDRRRPVRAKPLSPESRAPAATEPVPVAPPPIAPAAPLPAPSTAHVDRDTGTARAQTAPVIPLGPVSISRDGPDTAMGVRGGAPNAQSGVTIGSRTANTGSFRESIAGAKMKTIAEIAATRPPTGAELAELRESQRSALQVYRRSTTAGSAEVHVPQGEGMGGEGAVGGSGAMRGKGLGVGSGFSLPFLSKGPSAAQRKKNDSIDADYQRRLRRLQDRILLRRDSVRLDSLRRDSLARRRP